MKNYLCLLILQLCCCTMLAQNETQKWLTIANTQKSADALIENRKMDWGLSEKDALIRPNKMPKTDKLGFKHFRYQQTYENVPIEGAEWLVHEKNGVANTANGNLVSGLNLSTIPTLSEEQALQYALNVVNAEIWAWEDAFLETMLREDTKNDNATYYPTGELIITSPDLAKGNASVESYRLAYKFDVFAMQPYTRQEIYIDAHNGELVTSFNLILHADVAATGNAAYSCENPVNITVDNTNSGYRLYSEGRNIHVRTSGNDDSTPDIDVTSSDTFFNEDPDAVAVYYAIEHFYDYLLNVHGRNSIDGNGYKLKAWVHYDQNWNNAGWSVGHAIFGDGDNIKYSALTSIDIVAHEFTHGLTRRTARLNYQGESGALNEGFSDIFGTLVEFYAEPACADWLIGEDIVVQSGKTATRNMSNPKDATALNQGPTTYKGEKWEFGWQDHGGVHINSSVLNYWFYLIVMGGNGINDNEFPYSVPPLDNNANVSRNKAANIAFRSLTEYLSKFSQYADARAATIQAAKDLYGENSSEVQTVVSAWCAVGVGECEINTNTITLVTPNGGETWQNGTNQTISWISTGDITQVTIKLSINGGASWQTLETATNNDGSYIFEVPNMATTQAMISIEDSNYAITRDVSNAVFTIDGCDMVSGFESSVLEGCENESVSFTNTSVNAAVYEWRINESLESTNINFNYLFTQAGTYIVSLRSINGNCIDEYTEIITVYAAANSSFTYAKTDMTINCHAESADATAYTWKIDNVVISSEMQLEYAFITAGTYNVCLSVTDECGNDEECNLITVNEAVNCGSGEESWRQYLNGANVRTLLEVENYIYVGTDGSGLVKINQTNGVTTFINTFNSDLPNNIVYALLESSSGEIFVGTNNGFAKFDGNSSTGWTIFNTTNSDLPNNIVNCLLENSSGEIFVGTNSSGLAKFDGNSSTGWTIFNTTNSDLPNNIVNCLLENSSGEILIGTNNSLAKFDGVSNTNWTIFNTTNSDLPNNRITSLLNSSIGEIFVGTHGSGLIKFDGINNTGWTIFNTTNSDLPGGFVLVLLESSSGEIFVGTYTKGLAKFDGINNTGWTIFNTENSDLPGPSNRVNCLLENSSGKIFVGNNNGGLAKFDGASSTDWIIFNTTNSDLTSRVNCLLESSSGEIFVGTYEGLAKFDGVSNTGWTVFNTTNSDLPNNNITSLLENNSGEIFVGTNGDGLAKFDGISSTGWTIFNTENSDLPSNIVYALLENSSGEIFVGTNGLAKFDGVSNTGWTIFNTENSDLPGPSNTIYCLLENSSGEIFAGTYNGGLVKFDGTSSTGWTIFNTSNSDLPSSSNRIYCLLENSNGEIFVGTYNGGLAKFDGTSSIGWTIYNTFNSDLPHNSIHTLLENTSGNIFVGTSVDKLAKFDGMNSTGWTIYDNSSLYITPSNVNALLETSNNEIFIGTRVGISVFTPTLTTIASFTPPLTPFCTNTQKTFTNTSTNATTYEWRINGNLTSTSTNLTHTFTQAGEYTISLKAFDSEGCEDTYSQNITVYHQATDLDLGNDITQCDVPSLDITANVADMQSYEWQFNNTTVGTTANLTATETGTYTLLVIDMCGDSYSDEIEIIVGSECIWPGDFNYDEIVNNQDLLHLGLGFGESGFERSNASYNWEGQACRDWEIEQENGLNYKHLDADGSGTIDANDAKAIDVNYRKTHDSYFPTFNYNESHITLDAEVTSGGNFEPDAISTTIIIDLLVNEEDLQEIAVHGLAFDIEYYLPPNVANVNSVSFNFDNSFIGTTAELLTIGRHIAAQNKIEIALTRFDKSNALGKGKVGEVVVEVDIIVVGLDELTLSLDVSNINLALSNNTFLPVGSSSNNFTFTSESPCATPTNLQETGLTCTDVTLNWDAMPDAQAYQLRGRKAGRPIKVFPQMQNTFRTFTGGLQTNKTYEWGVRTKCDGSWTDYTPFNSFSTPTCKNSTYDETKDPFFVSESESLFSQINVYPNPAKNDLNISFTSFEEENVNIKVFDILGKTVLVKDIAVLQGENNFTLNIEALQSGSYFLQIDESVKKFIVF